MPLSSCGSLRENQDPVPRLYYYCLAGLPPPSLHPLPSLISNYLNLSFGAQGRPWSLNEAYFPKPRRERGKGFGPRNPTGPCLVIAAWLIVEFWLKRMGEWKPENEFYSLLSDVCLKLVKNFIIMLWSSYVSQTKVAFYWPWKVIW